MGVDGGEEQIQERAGCEERIYVSIRLRPLNENEIARNDVSDWECINENTIIYRDNLSVSERSMYPTAYTFDRVFSPDCSTRQVYEQGAKEVALSVVSGINSSVFAYGQTSSGKTFTMSGITEYTMADIYDYIERHKERKFIMKFSALEIYNESVRDLISADSTPLRLLDDPERGTVVERLTEETVKDRNHFGELLSVCEAQRQIGETSLNETSSRSHQILRVTIESSARDFLGNDKPSTLTATVNFVDLAGSERASQTQSAGTRLKEGCHINRSLLTLGTVIRKLRKGKNGHVPYRDSKLTRILQSSLGGNARTAIICTLSPARTHVEQSRNTLLFASCAKEVTTNAQVNVVMSDRALVKQLQMELARLQDELRSAGTAFIPPHFAALLREKDLEIEKLKQVIIELSQQLNRAWSEVEGLRRRQQAVGDERLVKQERSSTAGVDNQYPKLRVQNTCDYENSLTEIPVLAVPQCRAVSVRSFTPSQASDRQSFSSEESFTQLPVLRVNISHGTSSPPINFGGSDLPYKENEERVDESFDDPCKEVKCIESELRIRYADLNMPVANPNRYDNANRSSPGLNTNSYDNSNASSPAINAATSVLTDVDNEDKANLAFRSTLSKEQKELDSVHLDYIISSSEKLSYPWLVEKDISGCSSLKLTRSRSCEEGVTGLISPWCESEEKNSHIPIWHKRDVTESPGSIQRKFCAFKYSFRSEMSRNSSQNSSKSDADNELQAQNVTTPNEKKFADRAVQVTETEQDHTLAEKTVKDVGLDPIQDDMGSPSGWPLEFDKIRGEIIELWHVCHISLVYRTYFFLLFKGDPKDYIYMEVELRRLSFLKDTFSQGNHIVEDGQILTPDSSMKALNRERHMLSQQMQKRFSEGERENLFRKWGIGLDTKNRRLQLAHLLWTDTNMQHNAESAALVAKLVGLAEQEMTSNELFKLKFPTKPRTSKKFDNFKRIRNLISILQH
ncbi:hypothetical protein SLEP1_g49026 [Rubroshorea leprosula]|uniref:Kinesin-like protein n=1 Tax=Rubroshorea leprosula TaxID=152421 RepID=A0AAV5LWA9_9ROSI|nr:hypothetical protein SLEP1_g49026 [Rubroshorea leprosula]